MHDDGGRIIESGKNSHAVNARHVEIEKHDVDVNGFRPQVVQAFDPVGGLNHAVALTSEQLCCCLTHDGAIFDDEDGDAFVGCPSVRGVQNF